MSDTNVSGAHQSILERLKTWLTGRRDDRDTGDDADVEATTALRDWALGLEDHIVPHMTRQLLKAPENADSTQALEDGLMWTPEGYFRMARDPESNCYVLLFAYNAADLRGMYDDNGDIVPEKQTAITGDDKAESESRDQEDDGDDLRGYDLNVYLVDAFDPGVQSEHVINTINDYQRCLRELASKQLTLFLARQAGNDNGGGDDGTPPSFTLANTLTAINVKKAGAGDDWEAEHKIGVPGDDETGEFETSNAHLLSLKKGEGREASEGNGQPLSDTMKKLRRYWNASAKRHWRGKPLLAETGWLQRLSRNTRVPNFINNGIDKLRRGFRTIVGDFSKKENRRHFLVTLAASLVVGGGMALLKYGLAYSLLSTVGTATAMSFGKHYIIEGLNHFSDKLFGNRDKQRREAAKRPEERSYFDDMVAPGKDNAVRFCQKPRRDVLARLKLCRHDEAPMSQDDKPAVPVNTRQRMDANLAVLDRRIFGTLAVPLDARSDLRFYPNGVVALSHINDDNTVDRFYTYSEDLRVGPEAPLNMDYCEYLKGKIYKLTIDKNAAALEGREISEADFRGYLRDNFASAANDDNSDPQAIAGIFNREGINDGYSWLLDNVIEHPAAAERKRERDPALHAG